MINLLFLILSLYSFNCEIWNHIVMVRGSSGWEYYRQESDVWNAIYILQNTYFVDRKHMTVMIYNDIAFNEKNPYKGVIINKPNGTNIYPKNFTLNFQGKNVTVANFLISLEEMPTTADDNVLIYFSGHGGPNVLLFPDGKLYSFELIHILMELKKVGKFNKLVLLIDSCLAGSVVEDLPPDFGIYAATSSDAKTPALAGGWDEKLGVFTNDQWSRVIWEDIKLGNLNRWTFEGSYLNGLRWIYTNPSQYGDMSVKDMDISEFISRDAGVLHNISKN